MASRGINKVILVGNLGADPEIRTSPNGSVIANLRLATGEAWRDQQGQMQERTEWHRVVMFGRTAEIARDYLKKGSKLYIEGRLQTRKWQDKNGQDQYTTEIVGNEMQMLDRAGGGGEASFESRPPRRDYQQQPASNTGLTPPPPSSSNAPSGDFAFDDDIPF